MPTNEGVENASPFGADRLLRCIERVIIVVRCRLALRRMRGAGVNVMLCASTGQTAQPAWHKHDL